MHNIVSVCLEIYCCNGIFLKTFVMLLMSAHWMLQYDLVSFIRVWALSKAFWHRFFRVFPRSENLSSGCLVRCCFPERDVLVKSSCPVPDPYLLLSVSACALSFPPSLQKESNSTVAFPMSPMVICRKESSSSLSVFWATTGERTKSFSRCSCGGGIFSDNADGGGGGGLDGRPFLDTKAPTGVDESSEEQSLGRFHGDKHVWVSISWTSFNGDNLLQLGSSFLIMRRICWSFCFSCLLSFHKDLPLMGALLLLGFLNVERLLLSFLIAESSSFVQLFISSGSLEKRSKLSSLQVILNIPPASVFSWAPRLEPPNTVSSWQCLSGRP